MADQSICRESRHATPLYRRTDKRFGVGYQPNKTLYKHGGFPFIGFASVRDISRVKIDLMVTSLLRVLTHGFSISCLMKF